MRGIDKFQARWPIETAILTDLLGEPEPVESNDERLVWDKGSSGFGRWCGFMIIHDAEDQGWRFYNQDHWDHRNDPVPFAQIVTEAECYLEKRRKL